MTISKSHYHRNRLLRDRIRKEEARHHAAGTPPEKEQELEQEDIFDLPDYFREIAESNKHEHIEPPPPQVILWDEVA